MRMILLVSPYWNPRMLLQSELEKLWSQSSTIKEAIKVFKKILDIKSSLKLHINIANEETTTTKAEVEMAEAEKYTIKLEGFNSSKLRGGRNRT